VGCARQSGVKISSFSCRTNRKTGGGGGTTETALLVAVRLKVKNVLVLEKCDTKKMFCFELKDASFIKKRLLINESKL
jgi:hypothetical protein